ncbi:MAG: UDP-N-acetylglucosamine--N-acetylmuramyl-(pentapeptide) pyrophosphoryl-undecaprenol N-acetylglucosamine transferase [Candidatus Omnitrophica bacterium]|nr:UDP-N-acetylglucosamine--N-acetylmuramyl-(pentapeptide) pyrophosphoryl-undecaprenol N-acetylglucosamine transferase [Candidatus Omnitrophota bacterium]
MEKIIIITGPTGGHFFPGLAIGERLKNHFKVKFFIPQREFILKILKNKKFDYKIIPSVKVNKKNFFLSVFRVFYLVIFSVQLFRREKPSLVIGTGSYVCIPFILGAKILNKKIIIHEQNYIPSKTTRFLAPFVNFIFLSFPNYEKLPKKKCIITGFPLISDFYKTYSKEEILKDLGLEKKETVLIIGGSQGARFLNNIVVNHLEYFKAKNFQIILIAGKEKESVEKVIIEKNLSGKVYNFFYEMNKLYAVADYVISRAGAGTIAELTMKKIPAFLIPYPYAGNHQKKNAEYLCKIGCAFMVEERKINDKNFIFLFEEFVKKSQEIRENLKKIDITEKEVIENFILDLFKKNEKRDN